MADELRNRDEGPNDLTIFRKYPLIQQYYDLHLKTAWFGLLMMDNIFLLEKIQSGPYWTANESHGVRLRRFWGAVFEKYVNELLKQATKGTDSIFLPDPRASDPNKQLCDGVVISGDSIVFMEYKSSMFRADTKYGGSFAALADEIGKKLVRDKEAGRKKGVEQLAESVRHVFGSGEGLPGVDHRKIKRVYLYLVTLDSVGGTVGMSPYLDTFLDELLPKSAFPTLTIRPLYCSDISALERVASYLGERTLPSILEQWFTINSSLTAPLSTIDFGEMRLHRNDWLWSEWLAIFQRLARTLFPNESNHQNP
jgi:hypothetical protein